MIQNLDAHLNKLQTQCDYLRHKLSTFPEGELSIQKMVLTTAGLLKIRSSLYIAQSQIVLLRKLWL